MLTALNADRAVPTMIIHEFVDSTSYSEGICWWGVAGWGPHAPMDTLGVWGPRWGLGLRISGPIDTLEVTMVPS